MHENLLIENNKIFSFLSLENGSSLKVWFMQVAIHIWSNLQKIEIKDNLIWIKDF